MALTEGCGTAGLEARLRAWSTEGAVSLHTGKSPGLMFMLSKVVMREDSANLRLCVMLETYTMVGLLKLNEWPGLSLMWTKMALLVSCSVIAFLWVSILAFKETPVSP